MSETYIAVWNMKETTNNRLIDITKEIDNTTFKLKSLTIFIYMKLQCKLSITKIFRLPWPIQVSLHKIYTANTNAITASCIGLANNTCGLTSLNIYRCGWPNHG